MKLPGWVVLLALVVAPLAARAEPVPSLFGGQLVRSTTLDGVPSLELGGGGALYFDGTRLYWGGGGGSIFQLGEVGDAGALELFHGELLLGYDLVQSTGTYLSVMALAGIGMTKQESGVFGLAEARLALREQLTRWFMIGVHLGYRRAIASDYVAVEDGGLSGPVLGLELYFTH
jgi:hypothetical protein